MKPVTKALLLTANPPEPRMGGYGYHEPEMRNGGYGHYEIEDRGGRQPRDDRGRYMPRNEYIPAEMTERPHREPVHTGETVRPMNRIGFDTGEVRTDYAARVEYPRMNEMAYHKTDARMGHGKTDGSYKLTRELADEWMDSLENEDGTMGAHWTYEQARQVMAQKNVSGDPLTFYVVLNMIYSDYSKVFRKYGLNDKLDFYVDMTKAFIDDKDSIGKDKVAAYFENVVKH